MISFLDLKGLNAEYRAELIEACTRVIDSDWWIQGINKKGDNRC